MGASTIRVYYLEPKEAINGSYYAMAGGQISIDPVSIKQNVSGMTQLVDFEIMTPNPDSRVCSPTVDALEIQASKSTNKSSTFKASAGVEYDSKDKSWKPSVELGYEHTWGSSSTYTYNMTNVNLTQKNNNYGYASWCYDYMAEDGDKIWNAYLISSSKVAGQVVYRLNSKPTNKNRKNNIPTKLYYDFEFGAGNISTGDIAERMWNSKRELGIESGVVQLCY